MEEALSLQTYRFRKLPKFDPTPFRAAQNRVMARALKMMKSPNVDARKIATGYIKELLSKRKYEPTDPAIRATLLKVAADADETVRKDVLTCLLGLRKQPDAEITQAVFHAVFDPSPAIQQTALSSFTSLDLPSALSESDYRKLVGKVWSELRKNSWNSPAVDTFEWVAKDPRMRAALKSVDSNLSVLKELTLSKQPTFAKKAVKLLAELQQKRPGSPPPLLNAVKKCVEIGVARLRALFLKER
jgi:hypothetical protein